MKTLPAERAYKAVWHLLIAGVGVYEYRTHRTKLAKALAIGLIAFHADAAICDTLDVPTIAERSLREAWGTIFKPGRARAVALPRKAPGPVTCSVCGLALEDCQCFNTT